MTVSVYAIDGSIAFVSTWRALPAGDPASKIGIVAVVLRALRTFAAETKAFLVPFVDVALVGFTFVIPAAIVTGIHNPDREAFVPVGTTLALAAIHTAVRWQAQISSGDQAKVGLVRDAAGIGLEDAG
jgi:hypothetical protein